VCVLASYIGERQAAPLLLEGTAQALWLPERTIHKDRVDDPAGSYRAGGAAFHLSLTVRHDF
jgi:hypothetical protein